MTTMERTALCTVVYCPAPTNPDWHVCTICRSNVIHHHHVDPRRAGGSPTRKMNKANVVPLCPKHHEEVTLHKWSDKIQETPVGTWYVVIRDHDAKAYPIPGLSDGTEAATGREAASEPSPSAGTGSRTDLQRGHSGAGEGGMLPGTPSRPLGGGAGTQPQHGSASSLTRAVIPPSTYTPPPPYIPALFTENGIDFEPEMTFREWVEAAEQVKLHSRGRQWHVGDLVLRGEAWSECWQYLDELGYPQETLAQFANISRIFPREKRRRLPWSYHQSVAKHEDRFELLDRCIEEGWSRQELREAAFGPKAPRLARYSVSDLQERLAEFAESPRRVNPLAPITVFISWLEANP